MSALNNDPFRDSGEYFSENNNLIIDRSRRLSPELQKKVEITIEKYLNKKSAFIGEYKYDIQNGCIHIPWNIDIVNDKFIWMSIKNEQKEKIIFTYEDCNINTDNCVVLQQEFCVFSESGEWILPKKILDLYGCTTCVWIGCSAFAELMSKQEYQNICNDISANDFFEVLC